MIRHHGNYRNDLERFWSIVIKAMGFKSSGIDEQSKLNLNVDRIMTYTQTVAATYSPRGYSAILCESIPLRICTSLSVHCRW